MTVVLFLLVLATLIFFHELGHFAFAKFFGIRVDEFAIGFPPQICGWKKGETHYSLNLIPLGGYVKIFGEDPSDESLNGPDSKRSFVNAAPRKQILILLSGIFMNLIFAWILISISFNLGMVTAIEDQFKDRAQDVSVVVLSVIKDSPSEKAGLKGGDRIVGISYDGKKIITPNEDDIQNMITQSDGTIYLDYKRGNATGTLEVVAQNGVVDGKKAIGISMGMVGTVRFGFLRSFIEGGKLTIIETIHITKGIYTFIWELIVGKKDLINQIAGPVGIAGMVGEAKDIGLSYLLGFVAMISINLAMLNLVPFPALDGGRVLFILIEVVSRRKIKPEIANWLNLIGFGLLILLMLFVTYKDIVKLF